MPRERRSASRRRRRAVLAAVAAVCLLVLGAGWVGVRGVQARTHLAAAATLLRDLETQLERRDIAAARATLAVLQEEARAARAATRDPGWLLGARAPLAGGNLAAVGAVAAIVADLVDQVLQPLVDAAGIVDLKALAPKDGALDVAQLGKAAPNLTEAHAAAMRAKERASAIPVDGLLPQLRSALGDLDRGLRRIVALTGTAARAAELLPPMLGATGPRTYLVLFQNPAELRATGGIPGAFAVVRAEGGRLRLVDEGTAAADLGIFARPVLPLSPAMLGLYTERPGIFPANVNLTPHFPTAAGLAREMYRRRTGVTVDGVVATDPVALSYLLAATGPLRMPSGPPLSAANAVRLLLVDAYAATHSEDEYHAAAARAAFAALTNGVPDPAAALAALARAAGERRLLVWSAHPAEQRAVAGTVLEGAMPVQDGARPTVGVFLNDGTGAKLGYYLSGEAQLDVTGCLPDGRRELRLRVTLRSAAPTTGLPKDVLGLKLAGEPYAARTNVMIFSPAGGAVLGAWLDGTPAPLGTGTERRRAVGVLTVDLKPGASHTVEANLLTEPLTAGAAAPVAPQLWVTPGVNPWHTRTGSAHACRAPR
ncbi:DUF4012 domain-containing protein [Micromonospora sp. CPCC 206061]|uniref:DUF4012 domain-containing protein n=1 Tax=Micromonospora sp. CPCC 206061 TaxID=3122410 RepID=UPI002FF0097D